MGARAGPWRRSLRRLGSHPVARNAAFLYGAQLGRYVVPLATLPYLARVLHPHAFGLLAFALGLASICSLLVEFGFNFSATRAVARRRDDLAAVRSIAAGVLGAKCVLLVAVAVAGGVCLRWVGLVQRHPAYLYGALALAAAQGFSALWYFQGVERMGGTVARDLVGRFAAAAGIFLWVRGPSGAPLVPWLWAGGAAAATGWDYLLIHRGLRFGLPRPALVWRALRSGASMFLFRGSVALYTSANVFILGLLLPAAAIADFAGAEKMLRAAQGALTPMSQALFPRMSSLMERDRRRALRWGLRILFALTAAGVLAGAVLALAAPLLVRWVLGPGYTGAVPLLRALAAVIPLVAASNVLGVQLMLPLGLDGSFNAIVIVAGAVNLAAALLLVPRLGPMGMAVSIVASESLVTAGMAVCLGIALRRGRPESGALPA